MWLVWGRGDGRRILVGKPEGQRPLSIILAWLYKKVGGREQIALIWLRVQR
jgi:hypothetical protein